MESKVHKQKQQMPVYWEQSVGGVQEENSNMEEEDEDCEIQKPQMWRIEDEEQMKDPMVNIVLIFDLQMTNKSVSDNYKSEGLLMQRSKFFFQGYQLNQQKYLPSHLGYSHKSNLLDSQQRNRYLQQM